MKAILLFLKHEGRWPLMVALVAALLLLPGLGGPGFWEPQEIEVADRARTIAGLADTTGGDAAEKKEAPAAISSVEPPLTVRAAALGLRYVGSSELGARLPLALLGVIAVCATFFLGRRLGSGRAGLIASLVLLSFPLFLFQSRQLMSEIGAVTGGALTVLGLVGLAWPGQSHEGSRQGHPLWRYPLDLALVVVGGVMSYYAAGALLGLVVPVGAVGIACLTAVLRATSRPAGEPGYGEGSRPDWRWTLGLGSFLLAASAVLVLTTDLLTLDAAGLFPVVLVATTAALVLIAGGLWPAQRRHWRSAVGDRSTMHMLVVGLLSAGIAMAVLLYVLAQIFDLRDPIPGERALFGFSLLPTGEPIAALGGRWRLHDDPEATYNVLFEQIAFGLFPWVALAPIALLHLAVLGGDWGSDNRQGKRGLAGVLLLAWALLAWLVASVMARKVEPVLFPALPAVALAIGLWLDGLMAARDSADATGASDEAATARFGLPLHLPLVAIFAGFAVLAIAKDILQYPEELLSVSVPGTTIAYPKDATWFNHDIKAAPLVFGVLFTVALALGLVVWVKGQKESDGLSVFDWVRRRGLAVALGISVVFAVFLAYRWTPTMSEKLSSKSIFALYHDLREEGDELAIMGSYGTGPNYYAGGEFTKLSGRPALVDLLRKPSRVFALAPAGELCALQRAVPKGVPYYVLDNSNAKFLLLSNQLKEGEVDRNPLADAIVGKEPEGIQQRLSVNFDNRVELIGVNMPKQVGRGESFSMTLFFRVLKPVGNNWKIFMHFDGGGLRFQGDHDPIAGRCGTNFWQDGDYIIDTFTVEAGNLSYPRAEYKALVGFFRGGGGNWTNMKVISARDAAGKEIPIDDNNRVTIGTVQVR